MLLFMILCPGVCDDDGGWGGVVGRNMCVGRGEGRGARGIQFSPFSRWPLRLLLRLVCSKACHFRKVVTKSCMFERDDAGLDVI